MKTLLIIFIAGELITLYCFAAAARKFINQKNEEI